MNPLETVLDRAPLVVAAIALLLLATGLLAMLLPDILLRNMSGGREPMMLSMLPLSLGLLLFGLFLAVVQTMDGVRAFRSKHWKPVPARIVHSALVETMQPRSTTPGWRPDVAYDYRFNGQSHRGHRIAFHPLTSSDREGTRAWLQSNYPVGAEVKAHIDPASPADAVLERGHSAWTWWLAAAGAVLAGAGAHLLHLTLPGLAMPARQRAGRKPGSGRKP